MAAIEVTPAGNQLYEVEIRDQAYESRHEVEVPDGLLERLDTRGVGMQDIVLSAVEFLLEHEGHDGLSPRLDLSDVAARYDGFVEQIPQQARARASSAEPAPGTHVDERGEAAGDDRLLAEVERDQETGQASNQERRF